MHNDDSEREHWGSILTVIILSAMFAFAIATQQEDNEKDGEPRYDATTYPKEFIASYRETRREQ